MPYMSRETTLDRGETSGLQEIGSQQQASLTLHGTSFEHDGAFDGVAAQLVLSRRRLEELISGATLNWASNASAAGLASVQLSQKVFCFIKTGTPQ